MTTAFYTHPDCRGHDMGAGHPECPQRLDAIDDYLIASGLADVLERREAPVVAMADLGRAHESRYVGELRDLLEGIAAEGQSRAIDPDTVACPLVNVMAVDVPKLMAVPEELLTVGWVLLGLRLAPLRVRFLLLM